jgi:hypothetical protein
MPESDQLHRDKFKVLIYHGHIHIMPITKKIEDNENKNPHKIIIKKI